MITLNRDDLHFFVFILIGSETQVVSPFDTRCRKKMAVSLTLP